MSAIKPTVVTSRAIKNLHTGDVSHSFVQKRREMHAEIVACTLQGPLPAKDTVETMH